MKTKQTLFWGWMSLISITLTLILASIIHFYEFGYKAFIAGFAVICIISVLFLMYRGIKNKVFLIFYSILNAWIIIGFGLINGFWNHTFKVLLFYLHNGNLPPMLSKLFLRPEIGSFIYELTGILTFVISMFAAYYCFKFIYYIVEEEKHEKQ